MNGCWPERLVAREPQRLEFKAESDKASFASRSCVAFEFDSSVQRTQRFACPLPALYEMLLLNDVAPHVDTNPCDIQSKKRQDKPKPISRQQKYRPTRPQP